MNTYKQEKQKNYKEKIEELFLENKDNPEINMALENFFPKIPLSVFVIKDCYVLFEYAISIDHEIGRKLLWSSDSDLSDIQSLFEKGTFKLISPWDYASSPNWRRKFDLSGFLSNYVDEIISFINGDFFHMSRLLHSMFRFDNDYDYKFVLLRLLQLAAPSYYSQVFLQLCNIDFGDVDALSLEECLFLYFSKCKNSAFHNLLEDPAISLFTYFIMNNEKFGEVKSMDYFNYVKRRDEIIDLLTDRRSDFEYRIFETSMKQKPQQNQEGYSIVDVDLMSGEEFEVFVAEIFSKMGYIVNVTKVSRDFGVDVIAEKDGTKIGIQAKCYSNPVSNSAIQEIVAGMKYYDCQKGIVVTNSIFTKAAIDLARINSIQLWDRKKLEEKIAEIFSY